MEDILNNKNYKEAISYFNDVINIGVNYKVENNYFKNNITIDQCNKLIESIPIEGKSNEEVLEEFKENILPGCVNFSSDKALGFPDCGNSIAGIGGAMLSDLLQQNLINQSYCSPTATFVEISVIQWLRNVVGYENRKIKDIYDIGGIVTTGGTLSNCIAMLLARENQKGTNLEKSISNGKKYKIVIPKGIGHYSIKCSQMWLGCGLDILEVPIENYRYNLKELSKTLEANKDDIMAVVAYVGDSRTMTIDNLKEVQRIVKSINPNIWIHADACHGFSLGFSEKLKKKIEGIELFDSISTDPHKVLCCPYTLSVLLIKEPENFKLVDIDSDLIMNEDFALGKITPFLGSKPWISLKLWFAIKNLGKKKIGEMVEQRCKIANYFAEKVKTIDGVVVLNDIDINSVMFMYYGQLENLEDINSFNIRLYKDIVKEGKYYLHQFSIINNARDRYKNKVVYPLRFMGGNPNISVESIDKLVSYIGEKINRLKEVEDYE